MKTYTVILSSPSRDPRLYMDCVEASSPEDAVVNLVRMDGTLGDDIIASPDFDDVIVIEGKHTDLGEPNEILPILNDLVRDRGERGSGGS